MEEYLKASKSYPKIPSGYNQRFHFPISLKIKDSEILKLKARGMITTEDVKLTEILFDVRFATYQQLVRYVKILIEREELSMTDIRKTLVKLIRSRVINRFYLSSGEAFIMNATDIYPDDAFTVYCLELGGAYLLDSFSARDLYEWSTASVIKSSEKIGKTLLATEMFLRLDAEVHEKLDYFRCSPSFQIGRTGFKTLFHFCIEHEGKKKYYIGDAFRQTNNIVDVRERLIKLESLICTNAYLKYYPDAEEQPILLIFADTEEFLIEIANEMKATKIERVRYSFDERIYSKNINEVGFLLKYVEGTNNFKEVKSSVFRKELSELQEEDDDVLEVNEDIFETLESTENIES